MYPPESPQSPLDGPQIPDNEQIPKMPIPSTIIQLRKPSDTIKNNIDLRDDVKTKRTSLKIENANNCVGTALPSETDTTLNSPLPMPTTTTSDDISSTDVPQNDNEQQIIVTRELKEDGDNNNKFHRISSSSNDDDDDDDDDGDYHDGEDDDEDLENGNTTDASRNNQRDSIVSSEDFDVQTMNTINKRLSSNCGLDNNVSQDSLLSPNEGPLARRYAEIAHFKSNNTNNNMNGNNININSMNNNNGGCNKWSDTSHHLRTRHVPIGSIDSEDGGVGLTDDDLQALLPASHGVSRDDLCQSRASLVSSSDGGVLAEGETSSESSGGSNSPPCDLGLVERLLRTHPVWFLPGIQRAGAVHLLQGKEEGNFIVRGSSQQNTMAVSVRLPPNTGPYIEHYLIQSNDGLLSLESSRFKFDSIPALIAHYAQCCDELPVQLILPRALREAKNRQQLSSLALLGQEFWRYPMANPKADMSGSPITTSTQSNQETVIVQQDQITTIGTVFSSTTSQNIGTVMSGNPIPTQLPHHMQNLIQSSGVVTTSQAETPSDTTSSLSSFTSTNNQQLLSPESIDSVVPTMSPVESCRTGIIGKTSTFKAITKKNSQSPPLSGDQLNNNSNIGGGVSPPAIIGLESGIRAPRPTPPNTLNLGPLRTPPAPPPRWSKPPTPASPTTETITTPTNNFTVTTTVTFSVEGNQNSQIVGVTSPNGNNSFQTISKRLSPEGECITSQNSKRWQHNNKELNQRKILSPNSDEKTSGRMRRSKARKESKHYQESDILESPSVYCSSALGDKFSDYEDIWSKDNNNSGTPTTLTRGTHMSSFRPEGALGKRPDLLPETPTVTSLHSNLLSPAGSTGSSGLSGLHASKHSTPSVLSPQDSNTEFTKFHNNQNLVHSQTQTTLVHQTIRYIDEDSGNHKMDVDQTGDDLNRSVKLQTFSPHPMLQPRNRLGLILPLGAGESAPGEEGILTPIQTPGNPRPKQGSPFYAEPADALNQITRRGQPLRQLPTNQRFSEPPKGPMRVPPIVALSPTDSEKLRNAGSLDELKKKHRKARGKLDPWPLDSSWEFMGNDDENDYDTDANWKVANQQHNKLIEPDKLIQNPKDLKMYQLRERVLTIHQILQKRLPELNLPELVRCPTPIEEKSFDIGASGTLTRRQRISAYDNVEKMQSGGYAHTSIINCMDSAHSDDGTVFSEPWDSSQWDSFLPQDDSSDTIQLSKCRPAVCLSEDDTIIEESVKKPQQKIATILRNNRSIRDREILCHPRNKSSSPGGPGDTIGAYTLSLAADPNSTFARNIENFISCTKESRELAPHVVMRNMRQFMSGMKNYLVKHGEGDFHVEVQRARSRLKSDEFLNLDTILEGVMHRLVVLPLREHLYGLFVDYYKRSGEIQLLVENVKYACQRSAIEFGIRPSVTPPSVTALQKISSILVKLQEAELPLDKLEFLLAAVSVIFESTSSNRGQQLGADEFLPLLVLIVAKTGFYSAEIEAEFMYGLLQPSLLSGEAGYYLTALCSAVHVLKSFMSSENEGTGSLDWRSSSMPASSSVLRVVIPDEYNGSLQTRTLPVRPHTTTRDVCRTIAHKARITNPQDYGLFKLVDGEETLLLDNECPQDVRIASRGKHCILAYKRIDAKIAWPTQQQPSY